MIYVVSFLVGILNGLFASGAGQFLVFYLIYILKTETHKARALSVSVLSISSIISIIGYKNYTNVNYLYLLIIFFLAIISSYLGTKIMKNLRAEIINLISGILIVSLTIIRFFLGG